MRTAHSREGHPSSPSKGGEGSAHGPHQGAREDGASLVEFALVVPLFVFLLFAFIDFGLSFGGVVTLRTEVNAGARLASLDAIDPACDQASNPMLCTVQDRIVGLTGVDPSSLEVAISFPDPSGASPEVGDQVIVCAEVTMHSTTGLTGAILNNKTVYASSELTLEQAPTYSAGSTSSTFSCAS